MAMPKKKRRKPRKKPLVSEKEAEKPDRLSIKIPADLYEELQALKVIPEEPFHKVLRRLLDFYKHHQKAEKRPEDSREAGFIA